MRNFSDLDSRSDLGLLVESLVFQELYKFITQHFLDYRIHYWRTKSGAEVDFVITKNQKSFLPIEVKYRNMNDATISRSFRSFLDAYEPKNAVIITKDFIGSKQIGQSLIHFIPLERISSIFRLIREL